MARTDWKEIEQNQTLDNRAMADAQGGWFFYYNVFNRFHNPYAWGMQNSWISRGRAFDTQHNNFISFLRS